MDFNLEAFEFEMGANKTRTGNPEPELVVTTTIGKIKVNEAASRLLNIQDGEYMIPVTNYTSQIKKRNEGATAEEAPIFWGMAKGYDTGKLNDKKEPIFKGMKMSSPSKSSGFATIEGSSADDWKKLGGNNTKNVHFDFVPEGKIIPIDDIDLTVYFLTNMTLKDKMARGSNADATEE